MKTHSTFFPRISIFMFFIMLVNGISATTYTFSSLIPANWTNENKWSPSYPGTTIGVNDVVNINLNCFLDTDVNIEGDININIFLTITSGNTLTIEETGTLTNSGALNLNSSGELILDTDPASVPGGAFDWKSGGKVTIGPNGHMTLSNPLTVEFGRTLKVSGTLTNNSSLANDGILINDGILLNSGGTLDLNSGGELVLDTDPAGLPVGTFNWNSGGEVTIGSNGLLPLGTSFSVESGRTLNVSGDLNVNDGGFLKVYGTLNVNVDGEVTIGAFNTSFALLRVYGSLNVNSMGTLEVYESLDVYSSGILDVSSGGILDVYSSGDLEVSSNGTLTNNGIFERIGTFINNGTMKGTGTFNGNHTNSSTLAPGTSPGCFTIDGNFTNTGILEIELADGSACTNFDQIIVNGDATIGGIINITFPSGAPSTSTFAILTATGAKADNSPTINWPVGYSGSGSFVGDEYQVTFSLLPVELVYFRAESKDDDVVELNWQTASEQNNQGFEVQRSKDGMDWISIGFVDGAGTTHQEQHYSFTDRPGIAGVFYYRLRQIDFDGQSEYSPIRTVDLERSQASINVFPNPVTTSINIQLENDWENEVTLTIVSALGQEIYTLQIFKSDEADKWKLDLSNLAQGIYYVIISKQEERVVQKFIKK